LNKKSWKQIEEEKKQRELQQFRENEESKKERVSQIYSSEKEDFEKHLAQEEEKLKKRLMEAEVQKQVNLTVPYNCGICQKEFQKDSLKEFGGKLVCNECKLRSSVNKTDVCEACSKPLSGQYMKAQNKKYHRDCLVCANCKKELTTGFRTVFGAFWCPDCQPHK